MSKHNSINSQIEKSLYSNCTKSNRNYAKKHEAQYPTISLILLINNNTAFSAYFSLQSPLHKKEKKKKKRKFRIFFILLFFEMKFDSIWEFYKKRKEKGDGKRKPRYTGIRYRH